MNITKIVATRCHILKQKCTKFRPCWESLQRSLRPPSWILEDYFYGIGKERREVKGKGG